MLGALLSCLLVCLLALFRHPRLRHEFGHQIGQKNETFFDQKEKKTKSNRAKSYGKFGVQEGKKPSNSAKSHQTGQRATRQGKGPSNKGRL